MAQGRPSKKLWIPADTSIDRVAQQRQTPAAADEAGRPDAAAQLASPETEQPDELDSLLDQYDAQAAAATQATQTKKKKQTSQKGMRELREDGLATRLEASNKGFQLLQKMGYQSGQGLGRDSGGQADPVELSLKAGRTGLGVEENKKRQQQQVQQGQKDREAKRMKGQETLQLSFREQQALHFANKRAEKHVKQAREACETLDKRAGLPQSLLWPLVIPTPQQQPDQAAAGSEAEVEQQEEVQLPPHVQEWEERPPSEKLPLLLAHLRSRHHHCLFCGVQYQNVEELASLCPGEEEDAH